MEPVPAKNQHVVALTLNFADIIGIKYCVLNNHDLVNVSTEDVAMANVGQFDTSTDSNVINNICAGDKVMKVCVGSFLLLVV